MLIAYINTDILILLFGFINMFVVSESSEDKHPSLGNHVSKRNDPEFETCLESFDVYQDKIIRTQDSRDMGAKYINERDVLSRDDCRRICCETENCDVFVYEEKSPGGCYLFECGSPEDFKCKFTKHKNYTSAVLKINRHLTELETQIKFTQHEHELTKLRQPPLSLQSMTVHSPTKDPLKNQESVNFGIERPPNQPSITKSQGCSRYQFECHTSGECIAIYNACDGIPQCSDGSDEATELGCPATPTSPSFLTTPSSARPGPKAEHMSAVQVQDQRAKLPPGTQKHLIQQIGENPIPGNEYLSNPLQPNGNMPLLVPNSRASYGREGEGLANYHQEQQWPLQYHPSQAGSQIFTHKGNGLVPQTDRYPQHQYVQQETPQRTIVQQYGEQQIANDYNKYYYDNVPYRMLTQNQAVGGNWQSPRKNHEIGSQMADDGPMNRLENIPMVNGPGPDYYYEEGYRNRPQPPQTYGQRGPILQNVQMHNENKIPETVPESSGNDSGAKHDVPKKKPPVHKVETTTFHPTEVTPGHVSHRKVEKTSAELKMKESQMDEEVDGHSNSPSGAVLSLTMGLCITGIMLVFVGCRMKVVKRRMRRGGKSPYAHDADFLVNGMYL